MSAAAPSRDPVLVTGGTGFLGREIVRQLARDGVEVHVLARASSDRSDLGGFDITWHEGDLLEAASIDRAVASVCARARELGTRARSIHSGALISYRTRDGERQRAVNVEGTRKIVEAAKKHGVARLVYVSSVVTVGHTREVAVLDESAPFNSAHLDVDYVTTKRAAEELVLAAARELDAVVVNPGAIFGPIERKSNTVRLIRRMAQGRAPLFAPPGSISVVGVEDTARGILLALERGRSGERYLLVESSLSTAELFARIASALDVKPVRRTFPKSLWPALTSLVAVWDKLFPLDLTPPQALKMLGVELRFDASKARRELGWSPRPFDEVLAETIAHLRERGALEGRE